MKTKYQFKTIDELKEFKCLLCNSKLSDLTQEDIDNFDGQYDYSTHLNCSNHIFNIEYFIYNDELNSILIEDKLTNGEIEKITYSLDKKYILYNADFIYDAIYTNLSLNNFLKMFFTDSHIQNFLLLQ